MIAKLFVAGVLSGIKTFLAGILLLVLLLILFSDCIHEIYIVIIFSIVLVIPLTFGPVFMALTAALLFIKKEELKKESLNTIYLKYLPVLVIPTSILYVVILLNICTLGMAPMVLLIQSALLVFFSSYQSLSEIKKLCT